VLILARCGTTPRIPYTEADQAAAAIPNMADVRVFADVPAAMGQFGLLVIPVLVT
jgi:hypothetical protein